MGGISQEWRLLLLIVQQKFPSRFQRALALVVHQLCSIKSMLIEL